MRALYLRASAFYGTSFHQLYGAPVDDGNRRKHLGDVTNAHGTQSARDGSAISGIAIPDQRDASSQGNACVICGAIHSGVGCAVTLIQISSRRTNRIMTRTYNRVTPMGGDYEQVHGGDVRRMIA